MGNEISIRSLKRDHNRERSNSNSRKNKLKAVFANSRNKGSFSPTSSDIPTTTATDSVYTTDSSSRSTVTPSVLKGSIDQAPVKWEDGRRYHAVDTSMYMWPNDEMEGDRLMRQHFMLRYTFGGLHKAPVQKRLQRAGAKVLDVGTGPGTWCLDMAHDYSVADFVGIDISPTFPETIRPHNVTFQFGNVCERLPFEDNTFDYAFQRFLAFGFRKDDWTNAIQELKRVVKPGGWIELTEMDMIPHQMNETPTPVMDKVVMTLETLGQDPIVARKLGHILAQGGLEKVTHNYVSLPLGWPEGNRLGALMKDDMEESIRALQALLMKSLSITDAGIFEETVIGGVISEARQSQTFLNYHYAFGRVPKEAASSA